MKEETDILSLMMSISPSEVILINFFDFSENRVRVTEEEEFERTMKVLSERRIERGKKLSIVIEVFDEDKSECNCFDVSSCEKCDFIIDDSR